MLVLQFQLGYRGDDALNQCKSLHINFVCKDGFLLLGKLQLLFQLSQEQEEEE